MKREELIAYDKWLTRRKWGTGEFISPEKAADLYLAEHSLPPAEGAGAAKYTIIEAELQRAKKIHPDWTDDLYVQLAVMQEEAGKGAKAILDFSFHKGSADDIKKELIQTAAMCMRMLENFAAQQQPTAELQSLMNDISEWSDKTFGDGQRNPAILHHLSKEVNELIDTFHTSAVDSPKNRSMRMEFADCMMLLLDSASHAGFAAKDLIDALKEKLEINKARKWGKPDANGVIEHIKQPTAEGAAETREIIDNLIKRHVPINAANLEYCVKYNIINGSLLQGIRDVVREFATLHAQKIADKMVSERLREV